MKEEKARSEGACPFSIFVPVAGCPRQDLELTLGMKQ